MDWFSFPANERSPRFALRWKADWLGALKCFRSTLGSLLPNKIARSLAWEGVV
jgi:hypothetical protein